jgi:hypothetical protein
MIRFTGMTPEFEVDRSSADGRGFNLSIEKSEHLRLAGTLELTTALRGNGRSE